MYPKELMDQVLGESRTREVRERFGSSYVARQSYRGDIVAPPAAPGVQAAIDVHCHAHAGQQDALALAKHASANGMGGLLFKTIAGSAPPSAAVRQVDEELRRWCDEEGIAPTTLWSAYGVGRGWSPISVQEVKDSLDDGAAAVWMPVFTHANTVCNVVTRRPDPGSTEVLPQLRPPLSFEEATRVGHYLLDQHGRLIPEARDILHLVADRDVVLSFGHVTRREQWAIVEEMDKVGFKKAFIDHPYSPFIALTLPEMKEFAAAGVYLNFTYDELSPLLGINPLEMFQAVAEIGVDHVLLSSDAGEPLFPNSVECMRLMRAFGEAFGMSAEDVYQATTLNPARLLGAA